MDGELVGRERTSLVGAKNGDGGQLLNGSDTGDNSRVLGKLLSTNGERDGQDSGHGNGDTTDQKHQNVVDIVTVVVAEAGVQAGTCLKLEQNMRLRSASVGRNTYCMYVEMNLFMTLPMMATMAA